MSVLKKIAIHAGETKLDTWGLLYTPPGGGRYNGKLLVTNQRLCYDAKHDATVGGVLADAVSVKWGSEGYLEIPKTAIQAVEVQKSFLAKKVLVKLEDGSVHTFSRGIANIDPVAEAIRKR
jgi:hypothetical protein